MSTTRQALITIAEFETPPDLAVDVLSNNQSNTALGLHIDLYLASGVRLVWLVDPETRTVTVYGAGKARGIEYDDTDTLDGGDVLPGFTCKVTEIFA